MAAIDFRDIAHLVNLTKTTQIETNSQGGREGRWALYRAKHVVHRAEYPFNILYFYAAASAEDVRFALSETRSAADRHIVFTPSAYQRVAAIDGIERLVRKSGKVFTTREYLISFIDAEVEAYVAKIKEQAPRDYIDPQIVTPSGMEFKTPNPVLSFLTDHTEDAAGQLGIVLAEPGQGKTYMTRYLVSRLAVDPDRHLIPLMVDSSQWHSMSVEEQRSLEKTIAHSFRHFGAPIGWLEGHEDEFLRLTLKTDILRIVFDGFDEYILRNGGAVQPLDVLESLAELAEATSARIVVTSRTSFWEAIYDDDIEDFVANRKPSIFRIQPFDLEHAKNYFNRKLTHAQAENATTIYASLRSVNQEFVGRGFVLSLVADVATEPTTSTAADELRNPIRWITKALCRREQLRQNLPLTADNQLRAFRTFAAEVTEQTAPSTALLEIAIGEVREMLDPATLTETVRKLRSHPLLVYNAGTDHWKFKQDQILIFFLAEQIIEWRGDQVARFLGKARMPAEEWQDLGTMIVEIIVKRTSWDEALKRLHGLIKSMWRQDYKVLLGSLATEDGSRLASVIALMTVEKLLERGSSHNERSELLMKLAGPDAIRNLHFSGIVARYDFRGTTFQQCRFEQLTWANCQFDGSTEFVECEFTGGAPPRYTQGLGLVRLVRCRLDPIAEAVFESERIRVGHKKYSRDDLRSDLYSVLGRFISRGGIGLKTVAAATLTRGTVSNSRYRTEIIEMLESTVLEKHHISGTSGGYHIRKEAEEAVKFYASNNVFTGPLREAWEKLREKLDL